MTVDPAMLRPIEGTDADRQARAIRKDKPVKTPPLELRTGVVSAVDIAAGTCTIRLGGSDVDVPDVIHVSNYVPTVGDAVKVLVQGKSMYVIDRTTNLGPSVISTVKQESVLTEDFTTSTLYSTLPNGPQLNLVPVGPSGRMLVQISSLVYTPTVGTLAMMGCQLIHEQYAYTVNPLAINSQIIYSRTSAGMAVAASKVIMFQGLPPGTYSVLALYVSQNGSAAYFENRHIWAFPL